MYQTLHTHTHSFEAFGNPLVNTHTHTHAPFFFTAAVNKSPVAKKKKSLNGSSSRGFFEVLQSSW